MSLALIAVTLAQLLDLGTFLRMVSMHGAGAEGNPVVAHLLGDFGLPFVAVAKIAVLSVVVAVIVVLAGRENQARHRRLAATVVAVAVAGGIIGGLSNAIVIL
jgi:hypothetical protein